MKRNRYVNTCRNLLLASTLVFAFATNGVAAGPVAVAPGQSGWFVGKGSEKPVDVTLRGGVGYLTGESRELVYWPDVGNHKASELIWEIDSLYMIGFGASLRSERLRWLRWLTVNFDGWFKATDGDGTMDDYDWLDLGRDDWTEWSHHEDTDVTDGSIIDINGQISFYRTQNVVFNGYVGYKRDNFGWESRGGDFVYSRFGFRDWRGSFPAGELAISYEQTLEVPYLGLGVEAGSGKFKFDGRVIFSTLVKGESVDHHHMRNLVIDGDFSDGDMIAVDIAGIYAVTSNLSVELGYSFQSYDEMRGDYTWHDNDTGTVDFTENYAGMDQESSMFSISVLYNF